MKIKCPKCGETIEPQGTLCPDCGVSLKAEIEQVKEEERVRKEKEQEAERIRKEKKQKEEEQRRKEQEQQERAERLKIWEQERKVRNRKIAVCVSVLLILIAALIVYIRTRPDAWTQVVSGGEIPGLWQGSVELPLPLSQIMELEVSEPRVAFTITIDNRRDPDNMSLSFAFDFNKMLNELSASIPETAEEEFRAQFKQGLPVDDEYIAAKTLNGSLSDISQIAAISINQKKNKILWQMPLDSFEFFDIDAVECILEKTADVQNYKPGEAGEAGVVFYDKGSYSDGWRYLEVSLGVTNSTPWSDGSAFIRGLKTELGEGDFNTVNIVDLLGENTAACLAADYRGGGKTDWYLGNNKEMALCYKNLVQKGGQRRKAKKISGYSDMKAGLFFNSDITYYWTSEQQSATEAFTLGLQKWLLEKGGKISASDILPGKTLFNLDYHHTYPVRPIRKF